jgi:hypothetical protein
VKQILLIVAAVCTALLLSQLLYQFYEWDRMQSCATGGGRNCAGKPVRIDR